ncbi:unnamed protein product [Trichogramma brassicae]|uniref:Uncharacterized protein n=1 Tax=Trichogramma brassicae TaxID=86971 RepID=A0A6H5IA87_9HYME|nr:unnamed protein product [Trichogramma brassicae]
MRHDAEALGSVLAAGRGRVQLMTPTYQQISRGRVTRALLARMNPIVGARRTDARVGAAAAACASTKRSSGRCTHVYRTRRSSCATSTTWQRLLGLTASYRPRSRTDRSSRVTRRRSAKVSSSRILPWPSTTWAAYRSRLSWTYFAREARIATTWTMAESRPRRKEKRSSSEKTS